MSYVLFCIFFERSYLRKKIPFINYGILNVSILKSEVWTDKKIATKTSRLATAFRCFFLLFLL